MTIKKPAEYMRMLDEACMSAAPWVPKVFRGKGIVIVGGGDRYFPCAFVCISRLRSVGCSLPVELWFLGKDELSPRMQKIVEGMDVRCVDATKVLEQHPLKHLAGWECKPYAIAHSTFEEVLYLDADNVPVFDPTYLFETPEYRATGAIFWPDYSLSDPGCRMWQLAGVPSRIEREFESGQALIDKYRCWNAILLTIHLCEHGQEFWWNPNGGGVYGDKDLFRFAWHRTGKSFSMPKQGIHPLDGVGVMCQHDFDGRRIFQHRSLRKWHLYSQNVRVPGFFFEDECLEALDQLRGALQSDRHEDSCSEISHIIKEPRDAAVAPSVSTDSR